MCLLCLRWGNRAQVGLEIENGFHYLFSEMYVCVCLAVTQSEVEAAIEGGATSREAVTKACRAGGDCGACHGMIEKMIEDCIEDGVVAAPSQRPQIVACTAGNFVAVDALIRTRAA